MGFVTGHEFTRAKKANKSIWALTLARRSRLAEADYRNPVNGGMRIGSLGETRRGRQRRSGDPATADGDNFRDGWGQGSAHGGHRHTLPAPHHERRARVRRGTDWDHSPGEPPA
jgi:hypothetical protein